MAGVKPPDTALRGTLSKMRYALMSQTSPLCILSPNWYSMLLGLRIQPVLVQYRILCNGPNFMRWSECMKLLVAAVVLLSCLHRTDTAYAMFHIAQLGVTNTGCCHDASPQSFLQWQCPVRYGTLMNNAHLLLPVNRSRKFGKPSLCEASTILSLYLSANITKCTSCSRRKLTLYSSVFHSIHKCAMSISKSSLCT